MTRSLIRAIPIPVRGRLLHARTQKLKCPCAQSRGQCVLWRNLCAKTGCGFVLRLGWRRNRNGRNGLGPAKQRRPTGSGKVGARSATPKPITLGGSWARMRPFSIGGPLVPGPFEGIRQLFGLFTWACASFRLALTQAFTIWGFSPVPARVKFDRFSAQRRKKCGSRVPPENWVKEPLHRRRWVPGGWRDATLTFHPVGEFKTRFVPWDGHDNRIAMRH